MFILAFCGCLDQDPLCFLSLPFQFDADAVAAAVGVDVLIGVVAGGVDAVVVIC